MINNSRDDTVSETAFTIDMVAENAILLSWQEQISLSQHQEIISLQALLEQQLHELIIETVASYHCLMVYFSHQLITSKKIIKQINQLANNHLDILKSQTPPVKCIKIPVYYDIEQHWDLAEVAERCKLSIDEVIQQHSAGIYRGFALGFTPGFCYLASVPTSLQLPRKASPRVTVPKGAVAIAEQQSAIYPIESPGGWHIIGQTPLPMFESSNGQFTATIKVGDNVQFYPISKAEFTQQQRDLQG